ncbi:MAG TPA: signal peptidase I [Mycobacteriales bacterium]|nr:signal peptidase I [Mycobacteriales bacterium]
MTTPADGAAPAAGPAPDDQHPGTGPTPQQPDSAPRVKHGGSFWRELPFLILIALVLALLIKTFLVQAFYIPSASMENTLQGGPPDKHYDRVLVNKLVYRLRDVHRGEIIVFKGPKSWQDQPEFISNPPSNPIARFFHDIGSAVGVAAPSSKDFIKRVIGVGGDHVVCCDTQGHITVNGVPITEKYLYPGARPSDTPFDVVVPKGRLWVMGDNRAGSADSRAHMQDHDGTVPQNDVIGRAFVVVWPPSDWKTLPVPSTFHQKGLAASALHSVTSTGVTPLGLGVIGAIPVTLLRRRLRRRR